MHLGSLVLPEAEWSVAARLATVNLHCTVLARVGGGRTHRLAELIKLRVLRCLGVESLREIKEVSLLICRLACLRPVLERCLWQSIDVLPAVLVFPLL